jgi:serine protease
MRAPAALHRFAPLLAAWLASAAWAAPAEPAPAFGLIVRLHDAVPHAQADAGAAGREAHRWQRLVAETGLAAEAAGGRAPQLRPVLRDARLIEFAAPLPAARAAALAERLRARPDVAWVAPNVREPRMQLAVDPLVAQQWWLRPVSGSNAAALPERRRGVPGFERAWTSGIPGATGNSSVRVAVLDTGITPHPDLQGRILPGYDFVSDPAAAGDGDGRDADPSDPGDWIDAADRATAGFANCALQRSSWHGTVIAGLLAANPNNGQGIAGIQQAGQVLPVRVAGKCGAKVADILDAMRWAVGLPVAGVPANPHPVRVVNISFGGVAPCSAEYQSTIDEMRRERQAVVVAAAGNEHGTVSRPANCAGVIGVVAVNRDGFKTHYSNFGPALAANGVATVGGDDNQGGAWRELLADSGIVAAWNSGEKAPARAEYAALFGTSFAAPMVSGTLALMLSVNPNLSAAGLLDGIRLSARPHVTSPQLAACSNDNPGRCACTTSSCGVGLLDAEQALRYAADPLAYTPPGRTADVLDHAELQRAAALGADRPPNVAANPPANPPAPAGGGGGGGGAAGSWPWGAALAAAVLALRRARCARCQVGPAQRAKPRASAAGAGRA